ncbi:MAG: hypothetical protein PHT79_04025 [Syntrophomonadaceae bacterium]|nr:hypothetical protein [Syntrophomonadaceae bacterium]MDD3889489.1 hypothetical protein [Syntrophomonadaceae bacterium]MDD4548909.1 hypothetical protein [Syntrophomonadaceae bacterium]
MHYWEHSLIYRMLAGSWFFSWLITAPADISHYYKNSWSYRGADKLVNSLCKWLQKAGQGVKKQETGSMLIKNPVGFIGLFIFFYFGFDLIINLHDYQTGRIIIGILLAVTGLLLPLLKHAPGLWRGSIIYRCIAWWARTD